MPITYQLDSDTRTLRTRLDGDVTSQDLRQHFDAVLAEPGCVGELCLFLDASSLGRMITVDQIRLTAGEMLRLRERVRFKAVAVLAAGAAHYGMFRMSQVLLESHFGTTRVFRDRAEAEAWLVDQCTGCS